MTGPRNGCQVARIPWPPVLDRSLRRHRRSSAIVLFAIGLPVLVLFLALVIDVGLWYTRRAQVQLNADIAVMSAMGTLDQTLAYSSQVTFVQQAALGIVANNGYDTSDWAVTCYQTTSGDSTYVSTATITTTQSLPTFFWSVISSARPTMFVRSIAEKRVLPSASIDCGFIALQSFSYGGGGTMQIDSFDSTSDNYSALSAAYGKMYDEANAYGCSNGDMTLNGNVGLFGSLATKGNVSIIGGSGDIAGDATSGGTVSGSARVHGTIKQNQAMPTLTLPPVTLPADIASVNSNSCCISQLAGNKNAVSWAKNQLDVGAQGIAGLKAGGTYYFTQVQVNGQGEIQITGDPRTDGVTNIYLDPVSGSKGLDFGGGASLQAALGAGVGAQYVKLWGAGTSTFSMSGGTNVTADLYAPSWSVNIKGNPHLYGRMQASTIDVAGTAAFTYDEALGTTKFQTPTTSIRVHLID